MSEEPYKCQGVLSDYARNLSTYTCEDDPDNPVTVLHGNTRKSGRRFCTWAKRGDYATLEARAVAFLEDQGELKR